MKWNKLFIAGVLMLFSSCYGQEKTNTNVYPNAIPPGPVVKRNFTAKPLAPDFDTSLVSQYIRSIFQDSKGSLWFGTIGEGVVRYDVNTLTYFSTPDGFVNNTVYAINEDKAGHLWFGTDQGVYKYDGTMFKNYQQKEGLHHLDISRKSILVDRSGNVWVGTHGGVYQYDPLADTNAGQPFHLFPLLGSVNVSGILEDKQGNMWFSTADKGVFRYDGKTITQFNGIAGLGANYAGGMAQDAAGNIWFTTKNGIARYDGNRFTEITQADGLGGTEFWGIIIERSGIIWVTARGSTTRFDPSLPLPDRKAFTVYTSEDGFTCCVQSMFQDQSGRMWWGTGQGLYRFDGKQFFQVKQHGPW